MEQLKNAFYEVMYKYEKSFSECGVMANLRAWENAKAPLLALLRKHPAWQEEAKAVVIEFSEGRGIERDVVDEVSFAMLQIADEVIPEDERPAFLRHFVPLWVNTAVHCRKKPWRLSETAEKSSALPGRKQAGLSAGCAASFMWMPTVSTIRCLPSGPMP